MSLGAGNWSNAIEMSPGALPPVVFPPMKSPAGHGSDGGVPVGVGVNVAVAVGVGVNVAVGVGVNVAVGVGVNVAVGVGVNVAVGVGVGVNVAVGVDVGVGVGTSQSTKEAPSNMLEPGGWSNVEVK